MAIRTFAAKQPVQHSPSSKNHMLTQSPEGRSGAPTGQPLSLQRQIGNRAMGHLLTQRQQENGNTGTDRHTGGGIIQRFPSADEVRERSSKKSNKKKLLSNGLSQYEIVITLIEQYNVAAQKAIVESSETERKARVNTFEQMIDAIWKQASSYIAGHEDDKKRGETVESFRQLGQEIVLEKIDLARIASNEDYNQKPPAQNKLSWHQAVSMTARSNAVRRVDINKLITSLGLPLDFVAALDSNTLDNLVAADKALNEGSAKKAEVTFLVLSVSIPEIWPLIKSALIRKHLEKISPTMAKALSPDFKHDDPGAEGAFGPQPDYLKDDINEAFKGFEGQNNLKADRGVIKGEADKILGKGERATPKHLPGWSDDFKRRQAWEKKNVNLDDFRNLPMHEQYALVDYSKGSGKFNKPLRGDLQDMEQDEVSRTLSLISALNRLPPYVGPVYRHDNLFSGFREANKVGASTTDMAFLSTTKDASSLKKIDGNEGEPEVLIVLQSKTGRFIKPISRFNNFSSGDENEVLFKPGVRFRITRRFDALNGSVGPESFPKEMDSDLKSALEQDVKKKHIKIVLKKVEE